MTALMWDQVGERRYETGVDRGVLYLPDGTAVPWNGLTNVTENVTAELKSYYLDGIKYLDKRAPDAYSAKLAAFTYPDELDELLGVASFVPGVYVHDQQSQTFNLSYRTQVGNDTEGIDHGYKIHILYNVMASLSSAASDTIGETLVPKVLEWELTGTPSVMWGGIRPTSHISIHSRSVDPELLVIIEEKLYGSSTQNPDLPTSVDLLELVDTP